MQLALYALQSCDSHVKVTDSPLGQSVTFTQALATSSSTVPRGHPHPLQHPEVQTLAGSLQVPVQGTHELPPSKYSCPWTLHAHAVRAEFTLHEYMRIIGTVAAMPCQ